MREAVKMWKEWEEESGAELIVQFPVLTMGSTASEHIVSILNQYPDHKAYTPDEITEKYPALRNIPADYKGIIHEQCGIVRARRALDVVDKITREKYGADLKYGIKVTKVAKDHVITSDGTVYSAKNVIVSCGAYSKDFDTSKVSIKREIEYFVINDIEGMPGGIMEFPADGTEFYGMLDGDKLDQYKMGQFEERSIESMSNYFRTRLPDKVEKIKYMHPCYITIIESGEFQYKTDENGVHFAYGFSGTGFKFMPLHGKIVYDGLINKIDQTYIPSQYKAKL